MHHRTWIIYRINILVIVAVSQETVKLSLKIDAAFGLRLHIVMNVPFAMGKDGKGMKKVILPSTALMQDEDSSHVSVHALGSRTFL